MELENVYHVEILTDTEEINALLKNGWSIIEIGNTKAYEDLHGLRITGEIQMAVAAEKNTYEKFNLDIFHEQQDKEFLAEFGI
jgi:hypothetical protein